MSRLRQAAVAALSASALAIAACDGGDVTPTAPADDGIPAEDEAVDEPGQRDPGGELDEPDPGEQPPDADPDVTDG